MTIWKITSSAGVDMGAYVGATQHEALDEMARDAGYADQMAAAEVAGAFEGTVEVLADYEQAEQAIRSCK